MTIKYLALAAKQDSSYAEYSLGKLYEEGTDIKQNYILAAKFYKLASAKNFAKAQNKLAGLYLNGLGVEKSKEQANHLFKLAKLNESPEKQIRGTIAIKH